MNKDKKSLDGITNKNSLIKASGEMLYNYFINENYYLDCCQSCFMESVIKKTGMFQKDNGRRKWPKQTNNPHLERPQACPIVNSEFFIGEPQVEPDF